MLEGLKKQLDEDQQEEFKEVKGSVDLSDPDNLEIKTVSIELTHKDNLHVSHDYIGDEREEQELTTKKWEQIIDRLGEHGVEQLILTGGEPTMRDDLPQILQYAINNIETVTVQTNGVEPINFSDYDCNLVISVESINPIKNNEIRRMTDPEKFRYDMNNRVLIDKHNLVCKFCGVQKTGGEEAIARHLGKEHQAGMIKSFNKKMEEEGGTKVNDYDSLKDHGDFSWRMFYNRSGFPILEEEKALQKAFQTAQMVDNPVTLRATIFNHNDLKGIGYMASQLGADATFVPLKPQGRAKQMEEMYISPGRFKEAIQQVLTLNALHSNKFRIDHPLYDYSEYTASKKYGDIDSRISYQDYVTWWERGRASTVGVNRVHIDIHGNIMPTPYLREHDLGNIRTDEWETIYNNLAQFNDMVSEQQEIAGAENFDVRQRTLFGDPDLYMLKPYENSSKEVN